MTAAEGKGARSQEWIGILKWRQKENGRPSGLEAWLQGMLVLRELGGKQYLESRMLKMEVSKEACVGESIRKR